jgi:hypothetical protein
MKLIQEEAEKGFDNLKDLKERLPSHITYPEIRIAVAKIKSATPLSSLKPQHKQ